MIAFMITMSRGPNKILQVHGNVLLGCFLEATDFNSVVDIILTKETLTDIRIFASNFSHTHVVMLFHASIFSHSVRRVLLSEIDISEKVIHAIDSFLSSVNSSRVVLDRVKKGFEHLERSSFYKTSKIVTQFGESTRPLTPNGDVPQLPSFCGDITNLHRAGKEARTISTRDIGRTKAVEDWISEQQTVHEFIISQLAKLRRDVAEDIQKAKVRIAIIKEPEHVSEDVYRKHVGHDSSIPQKYLELFALKTQAKIRLAERDELLQLLKEA